MQQPTPPAGYIFIYQIKPGSAGWLQLRNGFFDLLGQAPADDPENLRLLFENNGYANRWPKLKTEIPQLPQGKFVSIDYD